MCMKFVYFVHLVSTERRYNQDIERAPKFSDVDPTLLLGSAMRPVLLPFTAAILLLSRHGTHELSSRNALIVRKFGRVRSVLAQCFAKHNI